MRVFTCLEQRAFGYSAHYEAVVWELPELFRIVKPLLKDVGQLQRFCQAIPAIAQWLPYTSDEGPMGYAHTILLYPFRDRVAANPDFEAFIKGFEGDRVTVCRECGRDMQVERLEKSYCLACVCGNILIC